MKVRTITFFCASLIGGALLIPAAQAQVGGGGGGGAQGGLTCSTNVTVTPALRGEGFTEPTSDITVACTGGTAIAPGGSIPLVDFSIFYNTTVTSRLLPTAGNPATNYVSEALLVIDEPGSGLAGYEPSLPQSLCATPLTGCAATAGAVPGPTFGKAVSSGSTPAPNVYQGVVNSNSVTFFGIPVLPPTTTGTRVFRITNVRVNAQPLAGGPASGFNPVQASISITPASGMSIANSVPIVGYVTNGLSVSAGNTTFSQSAGQTRTSAATLTFAETFGTAFKTRVRAQTDSLYAGQINNPIQNVPGAIYDSESNFILPVGSTQTASLADFGTRLKATFNNVPAGVRVFVSTVNVYDGASPVLAPPAGGGPIGGSAGNANAAGRYVGFAQLVNGESVNDGDAGAGAFPVVNATDYGPGTTGIVPIAEVYIGNGFGTAVWEVVNTNPNVNESFKFAVYVSYSSNVAQNSPPPGTATVNLSYAASSTTGAAGDAGSPLPRFAFDWNPALAVFTIQPVPSSLRIAQIYFANFTQGQSDATYTIIVSNQAGAGPTSGIVTVTDNVPSGLTATAMNGSGWNCTQPAGPCGRSDALVGGASYPPIAVTVTVAANASSPQINTVSVTGGGSAGANTTDSTIISSATSTALAAAPAVAPYRYSLIATVTAPAPAIPGAPTGTVAFYDNGIAIAGSATTLTSGGTADSTAVLLPGAHRLTVVFTPSNAQLFTSSTSPEAPLSIPAARTSTSLRATFAGSAHRYSLTAGVITPDPAITGVPAGTVTFYDDGTVIAGSTTTLTSAGTATSTAVLLPGTHRLTATFTPFNVQYFTSSTSPDVPLSSARSSTSINIASSPNPSLAGQAVTFTAIVTGTSADPAGAVQFYDGLRSLGGAVLVGGRASVTTTLTAVGVHDIFAIYGGDDANEEASARFGQRVERVTVTLSLTTSAATAEFGQAVTLTATLAPQAPAGVPAATGTVQFQEDSTVIGSATLAAGAATKVIPDLPAGAHRIFAVYSGDANWYGTRSSAVALSVNRGGTTTLLTSSATKGEVRLVAALLPAAAGGSVQFLDTTGNTALGAAQSVNGTATLALTPADATKIAGHAVTAIYSGSAGFAGSTSNTLVLPALRNAAGGASSEFAVEELVSLFGSQLAEAADPKNAAGLSPSTGGLSVNVDDATGAVFADGLSYVSPSQVNFLMPSGLARGPALVTLVRSGAVVAAVPVTIARVAPGIFASSQVVRGESGEVYLVLYGTGIRKRSDNAAVICMANGNALPVLYAGAQPDFAGLDQVNVLLPSGLRAAGTLSVSLMVDGQPSNVVTVAVE